MRIIVPGFISEHSSATLTSILENEAKKGNIWISVTTDELANILMERRKPDSKYESFEEQEA